MIADSGGPLVPLVDLCNPKQWPTIPKSKFTSTGYPVYGANGKIGFYSEFNHEKQTVLITCRGKTCGTINLCEPKSYVTGNSMALDDLDESRVCLEYLIHALGNGRLSKAITGAAQLQITHRRLSEIAIPLPPLPQQRRIAAVLDKASALRTQRRAAIARIEALIQSIFCDMFDPSNIPERTIGQLLESGALLLHKDGNHGSLHPRPEDFGTQGIPYLSAEAIGEDGTIDGASIDKLREDKAMQLRIGWIEKGDVLWAQNASVAKVALYDGGFGKALIGTSLTVFRPNPDIFAAEYLCAAFRSTRFWRELEMKRRPGSRNRVPIRAQRKFKIMLPDIAAQRKFSEIIRTVERQKEGHRASLANLEALFTSLQHQAFAVSECRPPSSC